LHFLRRSDLLFFFRQRVSADALCSSCGQPLDSSSPTAFKVPDRSLHSVLEAFEVGATANCEPLWKLSFCFKHDLILVVFSRFCTVFYTVNRNTICPSISP
jgi:hypothetical protein